MRRSKLGAWGILTLSAALFTGIAAPPAVSEAAQAPAAGGCRADNHDLALKTVPDTSGQAQFQSIQFLSAKIGRAAGNGFMIGTSDGGCSWQAINNEGKFDFQDMQFQTNTTGYIMAKNKAGGANLLYKTTDGGTTLTQIHTGAYAFNRVQFLSEDIGYGFTTSMTFRTTNGGQTWDKVTTPPNTRYVHFTNQQDAWAVVLVPGTGYEIKRTVNGGKTWANTLKVKSSAIVGGQIYGTGESNVWVVLYGDTGMSQTSYSLFHTGDAGAHWKQLVSNSTAGGGPAPGPQTSGLKGPTGAPENMQIIGREAAYLAASSGAYEKVSIGRSLDDGQTFKTITGIPGYSGKLSFTSAKNGFAAINGTAAAIYGTTDSGANWTKKFSLPANH
ncbi:hypothetical protein [Paenibacillus nasutitermitis]|uniref:Photosynthesis system II assembly factor Ycf48/Hcf136-like domain-containing protein n=1 Tax=Paenibacillus nasutitermitis TaxID=1652958 RepID=A0A916ZEW1_9BACL|nr:hypothetical protein [Paenibacillus nasutitermitis]GGD93247.1 hypothetical protein GCM10010911_59820 [Paenibacillus nasutitermitis]